MLVTAGATREAIDPVRVVTNRSSGRMGYRVAEAAWARGAEVMLLAGPGSLPDPVGVTVRRVETTAELEAAVRAGLPGADVLVMAAAPADYRPVGAAAATGLLWATANYGFNRYLNRLILDQAFIGVSDVWAIAPWMAVGVAVLSIGTSWVTLWRYLRV